MASMNQWIAATLLIGAAATASAHALGGGAARSTGDAAAVGAPLAAPAPRSLEAALAAVSPDHIRNDIDYLASDELAGRDTPSREQRIAARFLRHRVQRLGFAPGAKDGYFFQYPLDFKQLDEAKTKAWIDTDGERTELAFAKEFFLSPRSLAATRLEAGVVFCGTGSKEELAKVGPLNGRYALVMDKGDFGRRLDNALREAGAAGSLMTRASDARGPAYEEIFPQQLESLRRGSPAWPSAETTPALPRAYLTKECAAKLLASFGSSDPALGDELDCKFGLEVALQGDGKVWCENVCAFWPGSDPVLAQETIIVSAHYDHLGIAGDGRVFNGADDNGSGTCGLLALAEALAARGPLSRSVVLIWVSGEEKGLWGSQAWAANPWLPNGAKAVADINIDMIGRNKPDSLLITPTKSHDAYNGLVKIADRLAPQEGFPKLGSADDYWSRSDHAMFARLGIPVTFLFADLHEDYHRVTDDPEKIDCDKIARVVRLVMRMIEELQGPSLLPQS
ncbi:MAG: M28 family peptidase [Planctomycetes bacterium]|nr:M28 family peptidase [Planctomycetota bacterium]